MVSKTDLDLRVAVSLRTSHKKVAKVTSRFVDELKRALVEDGEITLQGFGSFRVLEYQGPSANLTRGTGKKGRRAGKIVVEHPTHLKVFFKKSPALRSALKRRR
jgi:nucleoid DNA-binding protein